MLHAALADMMTELLIQMAFVVVVVADTLQVEDLERLAIQWAVLVSQPLTGCRGSDMYRFPNAS